MSAFVAGCYRRRDYRTVAFYSAFLFRSFLEGGSLPADPDQLLGYVDMPKRDLVAALKVCIDAGRLEEIDGRLQHRRVVREVASELEFRRGQAALGRRGGEVAGKGRPKAELGLPQKEHRGSPNPRGPNPPLPAPAPPPAPLPAPTPSTTTATSARVEFPALTLDRMNVEIVSLLGAYGEEGSLSVADVEGFRSELAQCATAAEALELLRRIDRRAIPEPAEAHS